MGIGIKVWDPEGGMDPEQRAAARSRPSSAKVRDPDEGGADDGDDAEVSCKEACCSCFGGMTGMCAACCCCPFVLLPLARFVCVKVPSKLVKRMATKLRKKKNKQKVRKKLWRMGSSDQMWPVSLSLFGSGRIQDADWRGDERLVFVESVGFGNSSDWRELFGSSGSRRSNSGEQL